MMSMVSLSILRKSSSVKRCDYLGASSFSSYLTTLRRSASRTFIPDGACQGPFRRVSNGLSARRFSTLVSRMSNSHHSPSSIESKLGILQNYTACDIADALFKLDIPTGGFVPDLFPIQDLPFSPRSSLLKPQITIAPASTILFIPKSLSPLEAEAEYATCNIPSGVHWADLSPSNTFLVISQPKGQSNAVLGGIMALRAKVMGAKGILVRGRVRDVHEIVETGLPVWAQATSIAGGGQAAKAHATQVQLDLDGTIVNPGDFVFSDSINGVALIPREKLDEVLAILPVLVANDDKVKEAVAGGMGVGEAFKRFR